MPEDAAEDLQAMFAAAFRAANRREPVDLSELQSIVCTFVRTAKERDEPAQRVLVALKALTSGDVDWSRLRGEQQQLRESIIRWCLDEYYGPGTATTLP